MRMTENFPAFSLHGIQKSSPSTCGNESPVVTFSQEKVDLVKVERLFESYRDSSVDAVLAEGVERFCLDLDVDPTEFIVLALAWKFKAETMCKFTRKEFIDGFIELHCDSIEGLKSVFKQIESDAIENFKDLYRYTFQFALDAEQGQRSLPCNIATAMWDVVFSRNPPTLLQPWITFLQENNVRGISRDTWNMFLYLTECLNEDLSNYNDNEAWPSLFDDFVDYQRERITQTKLEAVTDPDENPPSPSIAGELPQDAFTSSHLEVIEDPVQKISESIPPTENSTLISSTPENPEAILTSTEIPESILSSTEIPGAIAPSPERSEEESMATGDMSFERKEEKNEDLLHQLHADLPTSTL